MSEELPEDLNEVRRTRRTGLYFLVGGGVLSLAGVAADLDAAIGPLLHVQPNHFAEVSAGTGVAMLGFWTAKFGAETFLDSWNRIRQSTKAE